MAVDKALNRAPLGLSALDDEPELIIEIELDEPEDAEFEDVDDAPEEDAFGANLAEELDDGSLTELAGDLIGDLGRHLLAQGLDTDLRRRP